MSAVSTKTGDWRIEFQEQMEAFPDAARIASRLRDLVGTNTSGRIVVDEDVGARGWFEKLLGASARVIQMHFALEWCGEAGSLIFFDDADSEYRVKDKECPVVLDDDVRLRIAHGEVEPHPADECLRIDRAIRAIDEYLETMKRPGWLEYHYVP